MGGYVVQQILWITGGCMYFQFLIEDLSTEILIGHVMEKLRAKYPDRERT